MIDLLPLLSQGEEGGGEKDEGDQGKPHLCQRGNHEIRACDNASEFLSLDDVGFGSSV